MKKISIVLLVLTAVLLFTACGKSEEAQKVDDLIASVGEISLDSEARILEAEKAVSQLAEKEQESLDNLALLQEARAKYNRLLVENVESFITAIGTVTLDSKEAIDAAQNALRALTKEEKSRVANADVLAQANTTYKELEKAAKKQAALDEARSLIRVTGIWVSKPDSAGGVELYFNFVNKSDKVIKYVNFGATFYNKVGDVVKCEYENARVNRCYSTGPFAKGEGLSGYGWYWGDYYNWDIASVELVSLDIEYMDGSTYTFDDDQIAHVQY